MIVLQFRDATSFVAVGQVGEPFQLVDVQLQPLGQIPDGFDGGYVPVCSRRRGSH